MYTVEQIKTAMTKAKLSYWQMDVLLTNLGKLPKPEPQQLLQQTTCYVQLTPLLCHYDAWCKETKRNGGVLVGSSIREFIEYLEAKTNEEIQKAFIAS